MKLIKSSHCVHQIGLHLVFCTKFRHQVLVGPIEVHLKHLIGEICINYKWLVENIEIMPDHVHIFLQIDPFVTPVNIVKTIKSITAVQIFTLFPELKGKKFWGSGLWSKSTYYGGVGQVNEETIKKYIEEQKKK